MNNAMVAGRRVEEQHQGVTKTKRGDEEKGNKRTAQRKTNTDILFRLGMVLVTATKTAQPQSAREYSMARFCVIGVINGRPL